MKQLEQLNPMKYKYSELKKKLKNVIIHYYKNESFIFKPDCYYNSIGARDKPDSLIDHNYLNTFNFEDINMAFENKIHIEHAKIINSNINQKYKEYLKESVNAENKTVNIYEALEKTKIYRQIEINHYKEINDLR